MRFHLYNRTTEEYEVNYPNFICMQRVNDQDIIVTYIDGLGIPQTRRIKVTHNHEIQINLM